MVLYQILLSFHEANRATGQTSQFGLEAYELAKSKSRKFISTLT
jgi:hypothetical protein